MNMFIILIPFLVSMAVFSHLAVLQFSLPADGGAGRIETQAELPLTLVMHPDGMDLTRGEMVLASYPNRDGQFDYEALTAGLSVQRSVDVADADLIIAVDDAVLFDDIVACMDQSKAAGYSEISLAGGAQQTASPDTGGQ